MFKTKTVAYKWLYSGVLLALLVVGGVGEVFGAEDTAPVCSEKRANCADGYGLHLKSDGKVCELDYKKYQGKILEGDKVIPPEVLTKYRKCVNKENNKKETPEACKDAIKDYQDAKGKFDSSCEDTSNVSICVEDILSCRKKIGLVVGDEEEDDDEDDDDNDDDDDETIKELRSSKSCKRLSSDGIKELKAEIKKDKGKIDDLEEKINKVKDDISKSNEKYDGLIKQANLDLKKLNDDQKSLSTELEGAFLGLGEELGKAERDIQNAISQTQIQISAGYNKIQKLSVDHTNKILELRQSCRVEAQKKLDEQIRVYKTAKQQQHQTSVAAVRLKTALTTGKGNYGNVFTKYKNSQKRKCLTDAALSIKILQNSLNHQKKTIEEEISFLKKNIESQQQQRRENNTKVGSKRGFIEKQHIEKVNRKYEEINAKHEEIKKLQMDKLAKSSVNADGRGPMNTLNIYKDKLQTLTTAVATKDLRMQEMNPNGDLHSTEIGSTEKAMQKFAALTETLRTGMGTCGCDDNRSRNLFTKAGLLYQEFSEENPYCINEGTVANPVWRVKTESEKAN